jgi:subtilisin-like proprotein convertase family protein
MSFRDRLAPFVALRNSFRSVKRSQARQQRRRPFARAEQLERREMLAGDPILAGAPDDEMLPDMFAWASETRSFLHGSYVDTTSQPGRELLRFSTAVANIGQGAMELRGGSVLPNGNQQVYQRVFEEGGSFNESLVGEFTYHPEHQHIHFDDYAVYNLRQALVNDGVGEIVASGGKVSFCLLDVTRYTPSAPSARYTNCGQNQGISVGWADVYDDNLPDQWIDVTDVADGEYWLEVDVDPEDRLRESNETNNIARVRVSVGAGGELGDRFEANDTIATATNLGTAGNRTENDLSIHAPGNDDYFHMQINRAGTLDIAIAFSHEQGDLDAELLDSEGDVVATSSSTDDGEEISHIVAPGETYYLRVFEYDGLINPHYDLTIDGPDARSGDRFEPNDGFNTATDLGQLGDRAEHDLSIQATGDGDYYRFTAAANGTLDVSLNFMHALGDLSMGLFNAAQQPIAESSTATDIEQLSASVTSGATYYLRVVGTDGATNEDYSLTFDGPGGAVGDRFENNDDPETATNFGILGDRMEQHLSVQLPNDDDYYRFSASGTGDLQATIAFTHAMGDLDFRLLNAQMEVVAESVSTSDDEQLTALVDAGSIYYLHVFGHQGATNMSYHLSIDGPAASGNIAGVVWNDFDADGVRDASEAVLPGRLVYVDANNNGSFDSFPPAADLFLADNLPLPIHDHESTLSTIDVSKVARPIESVSVQLSLAHSYVGDLHVHLVSPTGTRIELFSHVGGDGDNMTATTLADTAALSILQGSAPFSGAFRPLEALANFAGESANGMWTLEIEDDEEDDEGNLLSWSLAIVSEGYFEPSAFTNGEGTYVLTGIAPGTHTVAQVLPPEWEFSYPAPTPRHSATVTIAQTTSGINFGNHSTVQHLARVIDVRLQRSGDIEQNYAISSGPQQLEPIGVLGIDQIVVIFDRVWDVSADSLELRGVNVANYALDDEAFTAVPGDSEILIATWTLAAPIATDKLLAVIHASGIGAVQLDGEWTNPTGSGAGDQFPSGDGDQGGDFTFRFNVLPGDANGDAQVNVGDVARLVDLGFAPYPSGSYRFRNDVNGDGRVNVVDAILARNWIGAALPAGEPTLPQHSPAAAALVARVVDRQNGRSQSREVTRVESRHEASTVRTGTDRAVESLAIDPSFDVREARLRRTR